MCPFIWCVFNDTVCLLRYTAPLCINPATQPRRTSPVCIPAQLRRAPDVHSVLHLRSNLTFGLILPRILEQVLCPRCSTFILFFITFIPFHSISMFERFMKYNVSFTIQCVQHQISRTSILYSTFFIHFAFIRHTSSLFLLCISSVYPGVHPTCIPDVHSRRAFRRAFRHPFRSTSSVISYLRYNLTADSRTSPVPAIFHFYSLFYYIPFHSIYRCSRDLPSIYGHIFILSRVTRNGSHKCF
jgi:hypothetical protein